MHRILVAAALAGITAGGALTAGQAGAVRVEVAGGELPRGRLSWLDITLQIPDGKFVPAETRAGFHGAWIRAEERLSGRLPTLDTPDRHRIGGATTPILAYSGTVQLRLALDVPPGIESPLSVRVDLGYQLCDAIRCDAMQTVNGAARFIIVTPPAPEATLAFRADPERIVVLMDRMAPADRALPGAPLLARVTRLHRLPDGHNALAQFTGENRIGARRRVVSDGTVYDAIAEQAAAVGVGCPDDMPLALLSRVRDPAFRSARAKYFLAFREDAALGQLPRLTLRVADILTPGRREQLARLIEEQMRITLPSVFAPTPEVPRRALRKTPVDVRFERGEGRLSYHAEAFRLAPDGVPRLYVRAFWTVAGRSDIGMTLWIRSEADRFVIEQTDAGVTSFGRAVWERELRGARDIAANRGYAGTLLNVVPANDGWAYVLMTRSGYESISVWASKYTPIGPVDTGIGWGYGC